MSKGRDEMEEKIEELLSRLNEGLGLGYGTIGCVNITAQILALETPTHRIAIVRKKPELPTKNLYWSPKTARENQHEENVGKLVWGDERYEQAQQDMLSAKFVQEEKP